MNNTPEQSDASSDNLIQNQVKVAQIVFFALCASIVMYGFVVLKAPHAAQAPLDTMLSDPLAQVIIFSAFMMIFVSRVLPKVILRQAIGKFVKSNDGSSVTASRVVGPWFVSKVIQWAMTESVALFGFVLAFTKYGWMAFVPFALVSLILMAMSRPTLDEVKLLMRSL